MKIKKSDLPIFVQKFLKDLNWKGRKFFYKEATSIDLFRLFDYVSEKYYGFDSNGNLTGVVSSMSNDSAANSRFGMNFHSSNAKDTTLPIPGKAYIIKVSRGPYGDSITILHNPNEQKQLENEQAKIENETSSS